MYYINVFFVYSIIGFIFEIVISLILGSKLNSGILYGPWTPIYGIGVLIMLFMKRKLQKLKLNKFMEIFIYFFSVVIILTLLEQLGGVLLATFFHKTLWDYRNLKYHITKYIALETSLGWGIGAIFIAYIVHPYLKKFIKKIPFLVSALMMIIFSIDVIILIMKYL